MIGVLLEMLQATLTLSVLIMKWRDGSDLVASHVCSHVALTALLICKICAGTSTEMVGDATVKLLIEYSFFIFVLSSGLLSEQWYYTLVDRFVPPLRCLAGVAQIMHTRNLKAAGALSLPASLLHFFAAALRQATGVESSSVGSNAGQMDNLFGEWPMNGTLARLYILVQALYYWGAPMPPPPPQAKAKEKPKNKDGASGPVDSGGGGGGGGGGAGSAGFYASRDVERDRKKAS